MTMAERTYMGECCVCGWVKRWVGKNWSISQRLAHCSSKVGKARPAVPHLAVRPFALPGVAIHAHAAVLEVGAGGTAAAAVNI